MVNTHSQQRGSAHVVVTICLVIALIFALGWIFWQNFVHKETVKKDTDVVVVNKSKTDKASNTPKTREIQLANEKLFVTIPSSWKSNIDTVSATQFVPAHDSGSINNTDGLSVINVTSGISGIGGSCYPNTKDTLTVTETAKTNATVTPSDTSVESAEVYAVKSYYYVPAKGYSAFIFLTNEKRAEEAGSFVTCHPEYSALFNGRNLQGAVSVATVGGLTDHGAGGEQAMKFEQTKEQAIATLDTDDMNEAYTILQTARY